VIAPRVIGAASATAAGLLAGVTPTLVGPGLLMLIPVVAIEFVLGVCVLAITGAALAPGMLHATRLRASIFGWFWALLSLVALVTSVSAAKIVAFAVENGALPDLGRQLVLLAVGLGYGVFYLAPGIVIGGLAWVVGARRLNWAAEDKRSEVPEVVVSQVSFARGAAVALALLVLSAGVTLGFSSRPTAARCLDIGGEVALSGVWSPDGSLLAIASGSDPNASGHVRLFAWPSGDLLAKWPAWVEDRQTLVLDDEGRMIWVSRDRSGPYPRPAPLLPFLLEATASQPPTILMQLTDHAWDLSLVDDEIRGARADGTDAPVRIPLSGVAAGHVLPLVFPLAHGPTWWSPDGRWAVGSDHSGAAIVFSPDGSPRRIELGGRGSPRTFALTPDRSMLLTAHWISQSTMTELATGTTRPVLDRQQRWIVVSARADVAWATDDEMPNRRPCVAPLGDT
jgi:uncharacterized membrane protein YhaH (DUF805 family)